MSEIGGLGGWTLPFCVFPTVIVSPSLYCTTTTTNYYYYYYFYYICAQAFDLSQTLYSTFLIACLLRLILHGAGLRRLVTQYDTNGMMTFKIYLMYKVGTSCMILVDRNLKVSG